MSLRKRLRLLRLRLRLGLGLRKRLQPLPSLRPRSRARLLLLSLNRLGLSPRLLLLSLSRLGLSPRLLLLRLSACRLRVLVVGCQRLQRHGLPSRRVAAFRLRVTSRHLRKCLRLAGLLRPVAVPVSLVSLTEVGL